jgi:hypothetical protein
LVVEKTDGNPRQVSAIKNYRCKKYLFFIFVNLEVLKFKFGISCPSTNTTSASLKAFEVEEWRVFASIVMVAVGSLGPPRRILG